MADIVKQAHSDIPFNRAALVGNEWKYLAETVHMGHIAAMVFTHANAMTFFRENARSA
jgi:hypothetical protein